MAQRVALLLGKPPKPGTIVAEVRDLLAQRGVETTVVLPHEEEVPATGDQGAEATAVRVASRLGADLVVHRGLSRRVHPVLESLAEQGRALCNPWPGIRHTRNRPALHEALVAAGIPTPRGRSVATWEEVLTLAEQGPVVVKAADGGRGSGVLAGHAGDPEDRDPDPERARLEEAVAVSARRHLPEEPAGAGPFLVETLVEHDGMDRKLYVAGERVHGLYKPSTLVRAHRTDGEPFPVPEELRDLALRTAAALDLHLVGVDVVVGDAGPFVVDANPFPGYRSVDGAAESITGHLLSHL